MKSHAQQTKDYKEKEKAAKSTDWHKLKAQAEQYLAVLALAAGTIRAIQQEADNKAIVMGAGVLLVYFLITKALSKES